MATTQDTSGKNQDVTILDLDDMLDMNMDDVETLPDFVTPPPGKYTLTAKEVKSETYDVKEDGKATGKKANRFRISYAVKETHEVAEGEMPVGNGSMFSETFQGTEEGLKFFKKAVMNILGVKSFEGAKMRDVMEAVATGADGAGNGTDFEATISIRKSKGKGENANKEYENVQIRATNPTVAVD